MSDTVTVSKTDTKLKEPSMWKVVFHNDDYTPMNFVISLLIQFFDKTAQEAEQIMLLVHNNGQGVAGVYTHEIAKQKILEATYVAQNIYEHPLKITMERA